MTKSPPVVGEKPAVAGAPQKKRVFSNECADALEFRERAASNGADANREERFEV
jgi:hypothetical protein